jgi:hypothetical protein
MAKIIEYLASDRYFAFIINTAMASVTVNIGIRGLTNANGHGTFTKGDSFILLSYGLILPENFTFYQGTGYYIPRLNIYGQDTNMASSVFALPCFLSPDPAITYQNVTIENTEHEINGFCNYSDFKSPAGKVISDNFFLQTGFLTGVEISMMNVPAAWNGFRFYIVPFIKVAHNLPLI